MPDDNGYRVRIEDVDGTGWRVVIVAPGGDEAGHRACADEVEARTYASTVRQHIYWLSEEKFRQYYRLPEPAGG
ncbi:MAG: hypothetical protein ACJ77A_19255 [Actinomycetota bacterium]